eukprot:380579_1
MKYFNILCWSFLIFILITTIYIFITLSHGSSPIISIEHDYPMHVITNSDKYKHINYSECPHNFDIPDCSVDMFKYFSDMGFPNNCNANNCTNCLPPNTLHQKLNNIHISWHNAYKNKKAQRHSNLLKLLQTYYLNPIENDAIILIVLNYGFVYIFYNWVCSLDFNELNFIKNKTIVIPSDDKAKQYVKKAGFNIIFDIKWLPEKLRNNELKEESIYYFGPGFYSMLMLQMITLTDLIELGYNVLMLDCDIIWKKNVLSYFTKQISINNPLQLIDIWTMFAPRWDIKGFGNTGTIFMKSNCKTVIFMKTIMEYISLIYKRGDQGAFNFFINWKPFRQINFKLLDETLFIGGKDITLDIITANDFYMVHAFGVDDHFDKIYKFHSVNQWYFNEKICKHLFDESLLPH